MVIGTGSLRGAYYAGVSVTIGRKLGPDYFDKAYACSVAVYIAAFYITDQLEIIENTWRNRVSGKQLVNYWNLLKGRNILDLGYLEDIFRQGKSRLDLEKLCKNGTSLEICLTHAETGDPIYVGPKDGDILRAMSASCAYPVFHSPVKFNGENYLDGGISDPLPIKKALDDGYEEVVAILAEPESTATSLRKRVKFFRKFIMPHLSFSPNIMKLVRDYEEKRETVERYLRDQRVRVIRPSKPLPLRNSVDTNHARINESFDIGVRDAEQFLRKTR